MSAPASSSILADSTQFWSTAAISGVHVEASTWLISTPDWISSLIMSG
nr:hypothetical protein [Endozoicomonas sp. SESOKO1]